MAQSDTLKQGDKVQFRSRNPNDPREVGVWEDGEIIEAPVKSNQWQQLCASVKDGNGMKAIIPFDDIRMVEPVH